MGLLHSRPEVESRHGALRPRRDKRLYISCFGLSQGCGVRVGSRSHMFLVGVGTKVVFLNILKPESLFICDGDGMGFVFFFGYSNFWLIARSYSHMYHLNDLKLSKQKYGEYLDWPSFDFNLKCKLKTILALY